MPQHPPQMGNAWTCCQIKPLLEIVNSIPFGVFVVDRRAHVLLINAAAAALVGLSQNECFDRPCSELFRTSSCNTQRCGVANTMTQGVSCFGHCCIAGSENSAPIKFYSTPLSSPGGQVFGCIVHLIKTQKDVAAVVPPSISMEYERVLELLNRQWSENAELSRINSEICRVNPQINAIVRERATTEVVMMVADRLKNSAVTIGGLVRRLLRNTCVPPSETEKAESIRMEVEKLEARLREIELLAKSEKRALRSIDLRELLDHAVWSCSSSIKDAGCHLVIQKPPEPVMVRANHATLKMAISNVITKITRSSPSRGGSLRIAIDPHADHIVLTVGGSVSENHAKASEGGEMNRMHSDMDMLLARYIIDGHGGHLEERCSQRRREMTYALFLPNDWRMR